MSRGDVVVFGVGGHGRELATIAEAAGWTLVGFLDDKVPAGEYSYGRVLGSMENVDPLAPVLVGVGMPRTREKVANNLRKLGWKFPSPVVHPTAVLGPRVTLGRGSVVGSCTSVTVDSEIGAHTHLHSSVVVAHDCKIGDYCLITPRVAISGLVTIGSRSFIGAGAVIRPSISVGPDTMIGAGAAVVEDVAEGTTVMGVPARPRRADGK